MEETTSRVFARLHSMKTVLCKTLKSEFVQRLSNCHSKRHCSLETYCGTKSNLNRSCYSTETFVQDHPTDYETIGSEYVSLNFGPCISFTHRSILLEPIGWHDLFHQWRFDGFGCFNAEWLFTLFIFIVHTVTQSIPSTRQIIASQVWSFHHQLYFASSINHTWFWLLARRHQRAWSDHHLIRSSSTCWKQSSTDVRNRWIRSNAHRWRGWRIGWTVDLDIYRSLVRRQSRLFRHILSGSHRPQERTGSSAPFDASTLGLGAQWSESRRFRPFGLF